MGVTRARTFLVLRCNSAGVTPVEGTVQGLLGGKPARLLLQFLPFISSPRVPRAVADSCPAPQGGDQQSDIEMRRRRNLRAPPHSRNLRIPNIQRRWPLPLRTPRFPGWLAHVYDSSSCSAASSPRTSGKGIYWSWGHRREKLVLKPFQEQQDLEQEPRLMSSEMLASS